MTPPTKSVSGTSPSSPVPLPSSLQKLHKVAKQLEGVFVQELYKAMRETVPSDGFASGGSGEEMFTGLMDEHLAAETPSQWQHGIGEAVYRQLLHRLPVPADSEGAPATSAGAAASTARHEESR
jgi:peptidoglycan hydrolase FlgJ